MGYYKLGIFAYLCMGICQTVPIFPKGQKWEYSYWASANIGTQKTATGMGFDATLIIESFSNKAVLMKFSHMAAMYYSGDENILKGQGELLPEEAKVIEKPFLVHYDGNIIDNIFVSPEEPIWAVNMKKAVAGLFQLEVDTTDVIDYLNETNIYGNCNDVEYSRRYHNNTIEIGKQYNFDKCSGSGKIFTTSSEFTCQTEKPTIAGASRYYILEKENTNFVLKNVFTKSERFAEGFFNEGAYEMDSRQVINFLQVSELPANHVVPDCCTSKKDLIYENPPNYDMTHGRHPMTQDEIIGLIKELSGKVANRFEEKFVLDPNVLHQNSMQYMHWLMHGLSVEGFEKIYAELSTAESCSQDMRKNIMLELIPQIGTFNSIIFMKKMLIKGEFDEYFVLKMIAQYPFYVKELSEKLLKEIDDFTHMNLPEIFKSHDVIFKNTLILSFSNLISRTYQHKACRKEVFESYVDRFFNRFIESKSEAEKMVYVQALRNLRYGTAFDKLVAIVQDNQVPNHHLRFQAVFGLIPDAVKHATEMYKLFWAIYKNRTEHIEMRAMAIKMLLISEPTPARFFSMYWRIKAEPSMQLYNMYYSILNTLQSTTYPCFETEFGHLSEKFIKYFKKPSKTKFEKFTEVILTDYRNWDSGLASMFQGFIMREDNSIGPNVVYFRTTKAGFGQIFERAAVYLKITGFSDFLNEREDTGDEINSYKDILEMIKKANVRIRPTQELHVEFFLEVQNKVVLSKQWDLMTMMKQYSDIKKHISGKMSKCGNSFNMQFTTPPMMTDYFHTTDFGTFTHVGFVKNWIYSVRSNGSVLDTERVDTGRLHKDVIKHTAHGDLRYGNMEFFEQRLDYFNPIKDMYQGIVRMKAMQSGFAANISITHNFKTGITGLTVHDVKGNNGVVMHQQTVKYTANSHDILRKKKSDVFSVNPIMGNPKAKLVERYFEYPIKHLGIKVIFSIFDFEISKKHYEYLKDVWNYFISVLNEDSSINQAYQYYSKLDDILNYKIHEGKMGLAFRILPMLDVPSVLELTLRNDYSTWKVGGNSPTDSSYVPPKVDMFLCGSHYKSENPEKVYYWWNTTIEADSDSGLMTAFIMKFTQQRWENEKPVSYCLNYKLNHDSGNCPHPQADFYNLEPIKSSSFLFNFAWGEPKPESCPVDYSINYKIKATVSYEQIEEAKSAKHWPFKQCKEDLDGRKYSPATEACYRAAVEMSTYREYDHILMIKNPPKWLNLALQGTNLASAFIPGIIIPKLEWEMDDKDFKLEFTEIAPMDSEEQRIKFIQKNNKQGVDFSVSTIFDLFNPKVERTTRFTFENYGTCVISSDVIRTYTNQTIKTPETTGKYILLTECIEKPAYVIFMNQVENVGMKFHIATIYGNYDIVPLETGFEILADGKKGYLEKHHDGYYLKLRHLNIEMTFRPEFTVLNTPEGNTCGMCNLKHSKFPIYIYSKQD